jgi:sugar phosphate isomerase/epimerase
MDLKRVSVSTYPLIQRPLDEALAVIAAAGYRQADLLGKLPHLSLDPKECDLGVVKATAKRHGIRLANLGTYFGNDFASDDPAAQEADFALVKRSVDVAVELGARSIRVFRWNSPADNPALMDRIVPWLQRAAQYAEQKGVIIGMENHGGRLSGVPKHCVALAERVNSKFFGIIYDPCNLIRGGADPKEAWETMQRHIIHVHFKDGTQDPESHLNTPLGTGRIDFRWILRQADALGYRGEFTLEYELKTPPVEEGLRICRTFLEAL